MAKTFSDDEMLVWEAYPSGGNEGRSHNPHIIFNCLTNRMNRPRWVECPCADKAEAERTITNASEEELREMLRGSSIID